MGSTANGWWNTLTGAAQATASPAGSLGMVNQQGTLQAMGNAGWGYANPPMPVLTDSEVSLMAVCITGGHQPMDGKPVCFCDALRVQKGISKG